MTDDNLSAIRRARMLLWILDAYIHLHSGVERELLLVQRERIRQRLLSLIATAITA